ncbi:MAG: GDSL-type esterase/lipase family protein [Promicromonosporaceae bacterium]|nr:GDSL-type esterase/lipase family protein [Promicromonosporaceae bacterium]
MTTRELRICVIGDELVAGVGDARALGWVGRVMARSHWTQPTSVFTLATPGETTAQLTGRWEAETATRFSAAPEVDNRLVVALGRHDIETGQSVARSRLNLANLLDVATTRGIPTFVVGPPPGKEADASELEELSEAFASVTARRHIPYVDTFHPLRNHDQWRSDLAQNGSVYPGQAGYGLIAWLVLHTGWHQWLGLDPE